MSMHILRKGIRRIIHLLGKKKLISPRTTMFLLHINELLRLPDLKNPKDFNEKLMWIEHNCDPTERARLSDKYDVRKFIIEKGFREILIPCFGVYGNFEDIDFDSLPDSFVIKSTNGCGQTIIVRNREQLDSLNVKKRIKHWFKVPFGYETGEIHYVKIPPRIIIEYLLPMENDQLPTDYKFYCYNGSVKGCLIVTERNQEKETYKLNYIDPASWNELPGITNKYRGDFQSINRPDGIDEMIKIAEKLSVGFPFVRVDLYYIAGKIYFGEMTFTPAGCRTTYMTRETLKELGGMIKL